MQTVKTDSKQVLYLDKQTRTLVIPRYLRQADKWELVDKETGMVTAMLTHEEYNNRVTPALEKHRPRKPPPPRVTP